MNRRMIIVISSIATLLLLGVAGVMWQRSTAETEHSHETAQGDIYYCPMHPTVTSDKPGSCPICGMTLVKRRPTADVATEIAESGKLGDPAGVTISPAQQTMANVKTVRVTPGMMGSELVTTGKVTFDERRVAQVTSYTAGRIERLFADFTGDTVRRGDAVATIYSPELYGTQREFLVALANRDRSTGGPQQKMASDLVESSRRRLILMGMPSSQIDRLAADRKPVYATTITSPVSGIVTQKLVVPQQYVMEGQPLVEVADLSVVWVEADVFEQHLAGIRVGQRVTVSSPALPGQPLPGEVAFIQPVLSGETRSTRVRIELPNRNLQLKPDMYVSVTFSAEAPSEGLSVPAGAIVDRGQRQFVWVEVSPGRFSPRQVTTGARTSDRVEILSGLNPGENVVAEGAFLLDSESQLQPMPGMDM